MGGFPITHPRRNALTFLPDKRRWPAGLAKRSARPRRHRNRIGSPISHAHFSPRWNGLTSVTGGRWFFPPATGRSSQELDGRVAHHSKAIRRVVQEKALSLQHLHFDLIGDVHFDRKGEVEFRNRDAGWSIWIWRIAALPPRQAARRPADAPLRCDHANQREHHSKGDPSADHRKLLGSGRRRNLNSDGPSAEHSFTWDGLPKETDQLTLVERNVRHVGSDRHRLRRPIGDRHCIGDRRNGDTLPAKIEPQHANAGRR